MNFQTIHKQRKLILLAALLGLISLFLPWISVSVLGYNQSTNGFHGIGMVVFLSYLAAGVLALTGEQQHPLAKNSWLAALAAGFAALLCSLIFMATTGSSSGGGMGLVDAGFGFGIWVSLLASAGMLASTWLFKNPSDTLRDSFAQIKKTIAQPGTPLPGGSGPKPAQTANKIEELEKLVALKNQGNLSEEEFQQLKSKML